MQHAVDEGSTVYLLAGLPYRTAIWRAQWPQIMRNTIDAVASRGARLIFFDNVLQWGEVWHLPTAAPPWTGRELVAAAARELNVEPRLMKNGG